MLRGEWTLISFTVLFGLGFGLWCAMFCLHLLDAESAKKRSWVTWLAPCLVVVSLIVSVFHLASPQLFFRALSNWRTSWLAREVWFAGLFCASAFLYAMAQQGWVSFGNQRRTLTTVGIIATVLGLAATLATGLVYTRALGMPAWTQPATIVMFPVLGIASGVALFTAIHAHEPSADRVRRAMVAVGASLIFTIGTGFQLWLSFSAPGSMEISVPLWQWAVVWASVALALLAYVVLLTGSDRARSPVLRLVLGWAGFFFLTLAVTWSRVWFYTLPRHL